jgi:hypothetical protein
MAEKFKFICDIIRLIERRYNGKRSRLNLTGYANRLLLNEAKYTEMVEKASVEEILYLMAAITRHVENVEAGRESVGDKKKKKDEKKKGPTKKQREKFMHLIMARMAQEEQEEKDRKQNLVNAQIAYAQSYASNVIPKMFPLPGMQGMQAMNPFLTGIPGMPGMPGMQGMHNNNYVMQSNPNGNGMFPIPNLSSSSTTYTTTGDQNVFSNPNFPFAMNNPYHPQQNYSQNAQNAQNAQNVLQRSMLHSEVLQNEARCSNAKAVPNLPRSAPSPPVSPKTSKIPKPSKPKSPTKTSKTRGRPKGSKNK